MIDFLTNERDKVNWHDMECVVLIIMSHYNSSDSSCLTQQVSLEEQELLTLPEHLSSPLFFSGVRVT
jgi:hypothetical protein